MAETVVIKRRIYVASSWRNEIYPDVVNRLREAGHEVYDFRNPEPGNEGFAWSQCAVGDAKTIPGYLAAIKTSRALSGFSLDKAALEWSDTCVLVLPCGRSAHIEAGYAAGQGKDVFFLLHPDKFEPELMYLLGTAASDSLDEIIQWMKERQPYSIRRWHSHNGGFFHSPWRHALPVLREAVELCCASGAPEDEILDAVHAELRKDASGGTAQSVSDEWADVAIGLEILASYYGLDRHQQIRKKLDVLWQREWKPDTGGALHRIRKEKV